LADTHDAQDQLVLLLNLLATWSVLELVAVLVVSEPFFGAALTVALSMEGVGLLPPGCRSCEYLSLRCMRLCHQACQSCQTLSRCLCLTVIAQLEGEDPLLCFPKLVAIAGLPHPEHMAPAVSPTAICPLVLAKVVASVKPRSLLCSLPRLNAASISLV